MSAVELLRTVRERDVGRVYRAAFADERSGPREDFLDGQLAAHRQREGFALIGAFHDGALVGFVYGYTGRRGQWWTEHLVAHAPLELVQTWVGGHLEVVELAVVPAARGRGVGAALMAAVVQDRPEPCALLTTWQHPSPARRLYERLGWRELLHDLDGSSSLYGLALR